MIKFNLFTRKSVLISLDYDTGNNNSKQNVLLRNSPWITILNCF